MAKSCGCNNPNIRIQDQLDALKKSVETMVVTTLPGVTEEDNGKFLRVVNAKWAAVTVPQAEDSKF